MDGGVVTIRFEADTTAVETSIKKIESSISKINLKTVGAQATLMRAEAQKMSAEAKKMAAEWKEANKELLQQKADTAEINARARERLANDKVLVTTLQEGSKTLKAQAQINAANARTANANATAIKAGVKNREIDFKYTKLLHQQQSKNNTTIKENTKSTLEWYGAYYMITRAISQIIQGFKDIGKGIKNTISLGVQLYTTLFKIMTPLERLMDKFLKTSGLGNKIKQLFSFSSISNFAKSSIEAASDLTEVQNIVDTAFPNMADKMNAWAEDSINAFGLSEKSAKQYAATLGLMAQSAGLAEKASYTLGTGLTAVTADLASMYNMNAEAVYEKIRSGVIGGRTMAIAQLGINMSQANLQAYMTSKGITESYNALDNATKTVIRYNYVLEQTRKIQGDFIKTQGTWANQTRILSENIIALKAAVGEFLVSVLTPLLIRINGLLQLLTKAVNKIKEILPLLGIKLQKAAGSGNGASSGLEDLSDGLEDAGYAADEAGKKIAKLTDGPFSEMHKVGDDGTSIASKMKDIFGGDGLLQYESKYELPETLKKTETWLDRILKKLNFTELFAEFKKSFNEIKGWIEAIKKAWKAAWDNKGIQVLQSMINAATQVLGLINDISKAFRDMFNSGWGQKLFEEKLETAQKVAETIERIAKSFRQAWNSKSGSYGNVQEENGYDDRGFKKYKTVYRELTWGEEIAQTFYKIQIAIENVRQAFMTFIGNVFEDVDWEHILSILDGIGQNFEEMLKSIDTWLSNPENAEKWAKIIENIATGVANVVNSLIDFFSQPGILDAITNLILVLSEHTEGILWTIMALETLGPVLAGISKIIIGSVITKGVWTTFFAKEAAEKAAESFGSSFLWGVAAVGAGLLGSELAGNWIGRIFGEDEHSWVNAYNRARENGHNWGMSMLIGMKESANDYGGFGGVVTEWAEAGTKACVFIFQELRATIKNELDENLALLDSYGIDLQGAWDAFFNGLKSPVQDALNFITSTANSIIGLIDKLIDKIRNFRNEKSKADISGDYINTRSGSYANIRYTNTQTIRKHANGGVWAPNSPSLAILGDHPSQTEYALTEGHLDNIAERMANGIMNGFARVNLAGAGSGSPNIYVQIGDREIKDLIVQTVNEENYRRF